MRATTMIFPTMANERKLIKSGVRLIAAVDEAGRGALAGPVVAGAVLFEASFFFRPRSRATVINVRDSKLLTPRSRERLFGELINHQAIRWGIGLIDSAGIDAMNIHHATLQAMHDAVVSLREAPDIVLVDGRFNIPRLPYIQECAVHGDRRIFSIAAASIIAKVTRDRLMNEYASQYPQYGFDKHKGYGTRLHRARLMLAGPSPIHRISYTPVALSRDEYLCYKNLNAEVDA